MPSRLVYWMALDLTTPITTSQVEAALLALLALPGSPIITLEAKGKNHHVSWRLACDRRDHARVADALRAHLPQLHIDQLPKEDRAADIGARLHYGGSANRLLADGPAEPVTRTMLGALARAGRQESITMQVTLGPRSRPSLVLDIHGTADRTRAKKWSQPRFACDIRIGASAADADRARSLINSVIAGARTLEMPGVGLSAVRTSAEGIIRVSVPWFWRSSLSSRELVPLTAWPIGTPPLPGVPLPHPRTLHPDASLPTKGLVIGHAKGDPERSIAMTNDDALRHIHLIGPTGAGKSTLMARLALQDIQAGHGLCLIDPKGDLVEDILGRIPTDRQTDVVVLDPRDVAPVGLASLQGDPDRTADVLLGIFHSLYSDSWGPRSHDIIHASLLTLARRGDASLVLMPTLLTNPGFRRSIVGRLIKEDPLGLGSFWSWYEALSEGERQQAIAPVMNKLRPILLRPGMRHTLGQRHPRFEISDVFTKNRILLVSLAKGQLGPEAAQLIGSLVVALLWDAITARVTEARGTRHRTSMYIDEVQDYLRLPGDLGDALAQARGLGVSMTLAHQHLGQLSKNLRDSVLANARSRVMFGLAHGDAVEFSRMSRGQLEPDDFESLPAYEAYAAVLSGGTQAPWVSLMTEQLGEPSARPDDIRAQSRVSYGVPASEIDADLRGFIEPPTNPGERIGRTPRRPGGAS